MTNHDVEDNCAIWNSSVSATGKARKSYLRSGRRLVFLHLSKNCNRNLPHVVPRDSGLHTKQRSGLGTNRAAIQAPSLAPSPGQWVRPPGRGRPCLTGTQAPAGQRPPRGQSPRLAWRRGMLSPLCNPLRGLPCASASHLPAHGQRFLFLLCSGSRSAPSSRVSGSTSPFPFLLRDLNL